MRVVLIIAITVLSASFGWAQVPARFEVSDTLRVPLPEFRTFDTSADELGVPNGLSSSQFGSRKLFLLEESDLTKVPYEESLAKIVVAEDDVPTITLLVRGYRSYSVNTDQRRFAAPL